MQEKKTEHKTK